VFDELAPEHAELRQAARRFATEQLEPIALEIDRTGAVPPHTMDVLREHGYLGMRLPPDIGGAGLGIFE
jgi:alkylation response protein AidB-like acyl-CoA dehydrogenase